VLLANVTSSKSASVDGLYNLFGSISNFLFTCVAIAEKSNDRSSLFLWKTNSFKHMRCPNLA